MEEGEVPQPVTPPSMHMTVEDAIADRPEALNPFGLRGPATFPCPQRQAECFMGQHHCIRCRHLLAEARGKARRFVQAAQRRNRVLDRLAAAGVSVHNVSSYELQKLAKHNKDEERGQMSYEAHAIRNAKIRCKGHSRSRAPSTGAWQIALTRTRPSQLDRRKTVSRAWICAGFRSMPQASYRRRGAPGSR